MEIMVPRTYKITLKTDQDHYDSLNEIDKLSDLLNEITYYAHGGDLVGKIYLVTITNISGRASTITTWTTDPEDYRNDGVTVELVDEVDYEVEDCGIFYNA